MNNKSLLLFLTIIFWSFNNIVGQLTLNYPNGGESIKSDTVYTITWTASDPNIQNIRIDYSSNNGSSWKTIVSSAIANNGSYNWNTNSSTYNPSEQGLIRIMDIDNSSIIDISNNNFTLFRLNISDPNTSTAILLGDSYAIRWVASRDISTINLYYSIDNAPFQLLESNLSAGLQIYNWETSSEHLSGNIKLMIEDANNVNKIDISLSFRVSDLQITSPLAGEDYFVGEPVPIAWSADHVQFIDIEYSPDGGNSWITLVSNYNASLQSYNWSDPNPPSDEALLRVIDSEASNIQSTMGNIFSVSTVTITAPQPNEGWEIGSSQTIDWTTNVTGNLTILLSTDNGNAWRTLRSGVNPALGSISYTVEDIPTSLALIKIQFDGNSGVLESIMSDNFTIGSIDITTPTGGEVWQAGEVYNIQYEVTNGINVVGIQYSTNGINWNTITSNTSANGSYSWSIPSNLSAASLFVRVYVTNTVSPFSISAVSDPITISNLRLTSPVGNEAYESGTDLPITWTNNSAITNLTIEYSSDNGSTWQIIQSGVNAQDNLHIWSIPSSLSSNQMQIKITSESNPDFISISNNFKIGDISIGSPNGGEVLYAANIYPITWDATNSVQTVRLEYSTDGGASFININNTVSASDDSYNWNVPNLYTTRGRIRISDTYGNTIDDTSSSDFTIARLQLTSPNGGEGFQPGETTAITWISNAVSNVSLSYSLDGGSNWTQIDGSVPANQGTYNWTIPNNLTSQGLIRIMSLDDPNFVDISDANFKIASINLLNPNGGEHFQTSSSQSIEWNASSNVNGVDIDLSTDNGSTWNRVSSFVSGTSSYNWTVNNAPTNSALVRVTDAQFPDISDISDDIFAIERLRLVSPNGGELFLVDSVATVTWSSSAVVNVKLEYSTNNGTNWTNIIAPTPAASQSYNWVIPNFPSTEVLVKISDADNPADNILDQSDNVFSINRIYVTNPNGGESYSVNSTETITWISHSSVNNVIIEFSDDNGSTWSSVINTYSAASGFYQWTVPNVVTNQGRIRIKDLDNTNVYDISNSSFAIGTLSLVTPNGGEHWQVDDTQQIAWNTINSISFVKIEYSDDNGVIWKPIVNNYDATLGLYNWQVPNNTTGQALVRISDANNATLFDLSNSIFSIADINISTPNGGEEYQVGDIVNVEWIASNVTRVNLSYSVDNGTTWNNIATNYNANDGTYEWTIPTSAASETALFRVIDAQYFNVDDISDANFRIVSINLTSPNGGEGWQTGAVETITWTQSGIKNVNLYYSTDGIIWIPIVNNYNADLLSYDWTIPTVESDQVVVKMEDASNSSFNDISDANFVIGDLSINSPTTASNWKAGQNYEINWDATAGLINVGIDYSTDGGFNWIPIINSFGANVESYYWTIPGNIATSNARIRVRHTQPTGSNIYAVSDIFNINSLQLTFPNGGDYLQAGTTETLTWSSSVLQSILIQYSPDNGTTWITLANNYPADAKSYSWNVPSDYSSKQGLIKLTDVNNSSIYDESNSNFKVGWVQVLEPAMDSVWQAGLNKEIKWNFSSSIDFINVYYSLDGNNWTQIATNIPANDSSFNWTIQDNPSSSTSYIRVSDAESNLAIQDVSEPFELLYLNLLAPNGGENLQNGITHQITWNASNLIDFVDIAYSINSGQSWNSIATNINASLGSYDWTIPANLTSTNVKIKIWDNGNSSIYDISALPFTISSLVVTSPTLAEEYQIGKRLTINWTAANLTNLNIALSLDGGNSFTRTIASNVSSSLGTYVWIIPTDVSSSNQAVVKLSSSSNAATFDLSDQFVLKRLDITSPNGGEIWQTGTIHDITWNSGQIDNLDIYFSTNSGTNWTILANDYDDIANNSYPWTIPNNTTNEALLKLVDSDNPAISDSSSATFTISTIGLIIPIGGEIWQSGKVKKITWSIDNNENISIQYSSDNGGTWNTIQTLAGDIGEYDWNIPETYSTSEAKIRILRNTNGLLDSSFISTSNRFTIKRLSLTSHNSQGLVFQAGKPNNITFISSEIDSVLIDYSSDNGNNWTMLGGVNSNSVQSYTWNIPSGYTTTQGRIRLRDAYYNSIKDSSDYKFTIGNLSITTPTGGEEWQTGIDSLITWTSSGISNVTLQYRLTNSSQWQAIATVAASLGSYTWNATDASGNPISSNQVSVRIHRENDELFDSQGNIFTIKRLGISSPVAGTIWQTGEVKNITWNSAYITLVNISYSTNDGTNWTNIVINYDATLGTYSWTVPPATSSQVRIKIVDASNSKILDISNRFTIGALLLTSPQVNEQYQTGKTMTIQWNSVGLSNISLEYSRDNGSSWEYIATNIAADLREYNWNIPDTSYSNEIIVRITGASGANLLEDQSGLFTIKRLNIDVPNSPDIIWQANTQKTIEWTSNFVNQALLYYSTNSGTNWIAINNGNPLVGTLGQFNWTVPNVTTANAKIKIVDALNTAILDSSANDFSIGLLILTAPVLAQESQSGKQLIINWNSVGVDNIKIEYSLDNSTWVSTPIISSVAANLGTYTWDIPADIYSQQARIRITSIDDDQISDVSDLFIIKSLNLTIPDGGQLWQANTVHDIGWVSNFVYQVKLYYSTNSGTNWLPINGGNSILANVGMYSWTVPNVTSSNMKIKIIDAANNIISDSSSSTFTTGSIVVTTPSLSEEIQSGRNYLIKWSSVSLSDVKIEYSLSNGTNGSWITIENSIAGDLGEYNWSVPNNISTQQARIKITLVNDSNIFDISDLFVIKQLDLSIPNGGEIWQSNSTQTITWYSGGVSSILLYYTTNNGNRWIPFDNNPFISSDTTSIDWTVPNVSTSQARIRIVDANNLQIRDSSSNTFTMGSLSLTSPVGGEEWQANSTRTITWSSSNLTNVRLDYSTNNGTIWNPIINSIAANLGSYTWNIPESICSQEMRVRVASIDSTIFDISPTFSVKGISIAYPVGNELILVDNNLQINWTTCDIQNVNLYYSLDGGSGWTTLATNIPAANNTYEWNLDDNLVSDQVAIKIIDADNFSILDESGLFTIGYLRILNPTITTAWQADRQVAIQWESANINAVDISYSTDNALYSNIKSNVAASLSLYNWNIPNDISTESATIKLVATANSSIVVTSSEFTIKLLDLLSPDGNENWLAGTNEQIEWTSELVNNLGILISTNSGTSWDTIRANFINDPGSYSINYSVPQSYATNQALVKIYDKSHPDISDSSKDYFNINSLLLVSPNGGERFQEGRKYPIDFISSTSITNIVAEYSTNGGVSWNYISENHNTDDPLTWTIPANSSTDLALVRISDLPNQTIISQSAVFTIAKLSLVNPTDLVYWQNRKQKSITWNSTFVDSIEIDYSLNGGSNWNPIISTLANGNSSYSWTIPNNIQSDQTRIRILDTRDNSILSKSGADFVIGDVQIISPNNGEILNAGTTVPITYTYSNSVHSVKIEYSLDNGSYWYKIIENSPATGTYNWTIDADIISDECIIRVSHADSELQIVDVSDAVFTITALRIVSPNGGENIQVGDNVKIEWNSVASLNTVKLEYKLKEENIWRLIGQNIPANQGSFKWNNIPNTPSDSILLRLSDQNDPNFFDLSNDYFRIGNVQIISPNGGEKWQVGSQHLIEWNATYNVNAFEIFTSTDKLNWNSLAEIDNANSYNWAINNISSGKYYIKIEDRNSNKVINDSSTASFTISNIAITQPVAGDNWLAGSIQTIKWTNSSDIDSLEIKYSLDAGNSWIKLDSLNGNIHELDWTIPSDIASNNVNISINDYNYPDIIGKSGLFSIYSQGITIIQPNGGEYITAGQNFDITWNASPEIQNVKIERSLDNGASWFDIINSTPNDGIHLWQIPVSISSPQALIRISDALNPFINDVSDEVFAIGKLSIVNPNGNEVLLAGSKHNIIWTTLPSVTAVDLYFRENDNAQWVKINLNGTINAQDLFYPWNVPDVETEEAKIKIVHANSNDAIFAESDNHFSIRKINVISPNGGEFVASGLPYVLTWSASPSIQNVIIERSLDSGATFITIPTANQTLNDGSFTWDVPSNMESRLALIRIRDASNENIIDTSDASFTISNLSIVTPSNGEVLRAGLVKNIQWRATDFIDQVNLFYRLNDNTEWVKINLNGTINAQDLTYPWILPDFETENVKIKIEDANSNGAIFAESNGYFSIRIINVQKPNGGEFASSGMPFKIEWNASASIANVKIQYSVDSGATFRTISNPDLSSTQNDGNETWNIQQSTDAQYAFIRIMDAANNNIVDTSDEYFTISKLNVVSPNGGEHLQGGKTANIRWTASSTIDSINIFFRPNDTASWSLIAGPIEATQNQYIWESVPNTATQSAKIKVVNAASEGLVYDESENYFVISILSLTSPSGGIFVQNNNIIDISWENSDDITQVSLAYKLNAATDWQPIGNGAVDATLGTIPWSIDGIDCTDDLFVSVSDFAINTISDTSNTPIQVAKLDITSPIGGETWQIGSSQNISWDFCNISDIIISRSLNGGLTYSPIDTVSASSSPYNWNVDVPTTDQNRIKLAPYVPNAQNIKSESGNFTTFKPVIDLLYPNGSEHFLAGSSINVRWNSQWSSNISIELYDGDNLISKIPSVNSSIGVQSITLPSLLETDLARIKIIDLDNTTYQDSSLDYFVVSKLELITPIGGNYWEAGREKKIEWYASKTIDKININLYLDDTLNTTIEGANATKGTYNYLIPEAQYSSKSKIELYFADTIKTESSNYFKIASIKINEPSEKSIFQSGREIPAVWEQSPNIDKYKIELYDLVTDTKLLSSTYNTKMNNLLLMVDKSVSTDSASIIISDLNSNGIIADTSKVFSIRKLNILEPTSNTNWLAGNLNQIIWEASEQINSYKLQYTTDGLSWQDIDSENPIIRDTLSWDWNIPGNISSKNCLIKINDADYPDIADTTDKINIYIKTLSLQFPNGNNFLEADSDIKIKWTSSYINNVLIEYTLGGGVWESLNEGNPIEASSSEYNWHISQNLSSTTAKVRILDFSNTDLIDSSDNYFKIGWIDIVTPNANEEYKSGESIPINITTSTSIDNVDIYFTETTNPTEDNLINISLNNDISGNLEFMWDASKTKLFSSNLARIFVTDSESDFAIDTISKRFIISKLRVTAPVKDEFISSLEPYNIQWDVSDFMGNIDISYIDEYSSTETTIISNYNSQLLNYDWLLSEGYSVDSARIIIKRSDNPNIVDTSEIFAVGNLKLLSFNAKERINESSIYSIQWEASSNINSVKIEFKNHPDDDWRLLIDKHDSKIEFAWDLSKLPYPIGIYPSDSCYIRISDADNKNISIQNKEVFEIAKFNIINPDGGQVYQLNPTNEANPKSFSFNKKYVNKTLLYFIQESTNDPIFTDNSEWREIDDETYSYEFDPYELNINSLDYASDDYNLIIMDDDPNVNTIVTDTSTSNISLRYLELIYPNGNSGEQIGTTTEIQWLASYNITSINIFAKNENENDWPNFPLNTEPIDAKIGSWTWNIDIPPNEKVKIKIVDATYEKDIYDVSDNPFKVEEIKLLQPIGGEIFQLDSTMTIKWNSVFADRVSFNYTLKGQEDLPLDRKLKDNTGSVVVLPQPNDEMLNNIYEFKINSGVPNFFTPTSDARIEIYDPEFKYIRSVSESFTIARLELISPNTRTAWQIGTTQSVVFEAEELEQVMVLIIDENNPDIALNNNDPNRYVITNGNQDNQYSYTFLVENSWMTDNARVYIYAVKDGTPIFTVKDISDDYFLIGEYPHIAVVDNYQKDSIEFDLTFSNSNEELTLLRPLYEIPENGSLAMSLPGQFKDEGMKITGPIPVPIKLFWYSDTIPSTNQTSYFSGKEAITNFTFKFESNYGVTYEVPVENVKIDNKPPEFDFSKIKFDDNPNNYGWNAVEVEWDSAKDVSQPITYNLSSLDDSFLHSTVKNNMLVTDLITDSNYVSTLQISDLLGNCVLDTITISTRYPGNIVTNNQDPTNYGIVDKDIIEYINAWKNNNYKVANLAPYKYKLPNILVDKTSNKIDLSDLNTFIDMIYYFYEHDFPNAPKRSAIQTWINSENLLTTDFKKGSKSFQLPLDFKNISNATLLELELNYDSNIFKFDSLKIFDNNQQNNNTYQFFINDSTLGNSKIFYLLLGGKFGDNLIFNSSFEANFDRIQSIDSLGIKIKALDEKQNILIDNISKLILNELPTKYVLRQNYPNPFNPSTNIEYELPIKSKVLLEVYNILGEKIITLINQIQNPGKYRLEFNAAKDGHGLASGVYFYRIIANDFHIAKKMVLIK